jgi:hypothetical protein
MLDMRAEKALPSQQTSNVQAKFELFGDSVSKIWSPSSAICRYDALLQARHVEDK